MCLYALYEALPGFCIAYILGHTHSWSVSAVISQPASQHSWRAQRRLPVICWGATLPYSTISKTKLNCTKCLCRRGSRDAAGADGKEVLWDAIQMRDSMAVKQLLDADAGLSGRVPGRTPLHDAAAEAWLDAIYQLLEAGASASAADNAGRTPLHDAAFKGNTTAVDILIAAGGIASVSVSDSKGCTPLHDAAARGIAVIAKVGAVESLLAAGASVTAADQEGRTPLHVAIASLQKGGTPTAQRSWQDLVEVLPRGGGDACALDAAGRTPLLLAAEQGHSSIVETILVVSTAPLPAHHLAAAQQAANAAGHAGTAAVLAAALAELRMIVGAAAGSAGAGSSAQGGAAAAAAAAAASEAFSTAAAPCGCCRHRGCRGCCSG